MPLDFSFFCHLLSSLEDIESRDPLPRDRRERAIRKTVEDWFACHRRTIEHPNTNVVALFSSLFPNSRPDRVYGIQSTRLSGIIGRCLNLTDIRRRDLNVWREPRGGDLPACVERILR